MNELVDEVRTEMAQGTAVDPPAAEAAHERTVVEKPHRTTRKSPEP